MITERIDRVTNIPDKYRVENPPAPKSVKIELTSRCNYKCEFCAITKSDKPGKDIDFNLFKKITTDLRWLGVEDIGVFCLGESFTLPELLINTIKHLKEIGTPYVFLTSNGSLAKPKTVRRCIDAGLDSLKWSVNFYDKDQFSAMCGVKSSLFDITLNNIKSAYYLRNILKAKTKLYASSIRFNDDHVIKMQSLLKEKVIPYVDEHYWLPMYSMGIENVNKDFQPMGGNPGRYDHQVPVVPCWQLFTETHITSEGLVTACCDDCTGEWVMGDLKQQSFMDIWHCSSFRELRRKHLENDVTETMCKICLK